MTKIISFSLYGSKPIYNIGCIKNAELKNTFFKDWEMRVYFNNTVPKETLKKLDSLNVNLIDMNQQVYYANSMWRFLPLSENIERFISRDCDSRIFIRDETAVNEWIISDLNYHIIRDHPTGHGYKINAGMWGAKGGLIKDIDNIISEYIKEKKDILMKRKLIDQDFLADVIYPLMKDNVLVHDEFFNFEINKKEIELDRRKYDFEFIGESFDENDEPRWDQRGSIRYYYSKNKCIKI